MQYLPDVISHLSQAHRAIQACVDGLRTKSVAEAALDSSMLRLMGLTDYFMAEETKAVDTAEKHLQQALAGLGEKMAQCRSHVAGSVEDVRSRS